MDLPEKRSQSEQMLEYRERIKERIARGMDAGLHLYDAARAAGVSRALVMANMSDPDFAEWHEISLKRSRADESVQDRKSPEKVRADALHLMLAGGLVEKLGVMAAIADPTNELDREDIFRLAGLMVKLMPSQNQSLQVKADLSSVESRKEEEIMAEIEAIDAKIREAVEKRANAEVSNRGNGREVEFDIEGNPPQEAGSEEGGSGEA